ncbi:MAG: hypothetical protein HZA37_00265 [Parcubacteria group bacterium]|nr:hypothetical protein [Parcubacteria group bacterium]
MEKVKEITEKLVGLMGYGENDSEVSIDVERQRISVLINDDRVQEHLPHFTASLELVLKLIAKKNELGMIFVDVNNYRKERERLLAELAKAAAHKALMTKGEISLPPMNSYERRLIHVELASRPDVKTDSVGEGKDRHIVVRLI